MSHLIKLYYKFYRTRLPTYFENVTPECGESQHDLRHNNILRICTHQNRLDSTTINTS